MRTTFPRVIIQFQIPFNICSVLCLATQLCPTLCNSLYCNPPGSAVHWILQAIILEWVAMPSSRGSSQPRDQTQVSRITGKFFTLWATREAPWDWCTGMTQRDGMGREEGGGFRIGNTCTPMVDSCWCMAKPIQYCKLKLKKKRKEKK